MMTRDELLALIDRAADEGWKELDLSGHGLTELPAEIGKLTQLETLLLGKWEKEKEGPQGFRGYEQIGGQFVPIVSGNDLKSLPSELAKLNTLHKLDLSGNPLERIPDVVAQLHGLEKLTVIRASLKDIGAIAQLTNLTTGASTGWGSDQWDLAKIEVVNKKGQPPKGLPPITKNYFYDNAS